MDEYCEYPVGDCLIHRAKPRALVALSDDRQWLVALEPERWSGFGIYHREWVSGTFATSGYWHWVKKDYAEDTGQSAKDVLYDFLASA